MSAYLAKSLSSEDKRLYLEWCVLSGSSTSQMLKKLERLNEHYMELEKQDTKLSRSKKTDQQSNKGNKM